MPHLLNVWPTVERRIHDAHRVLLLSDYDGTLTPIVGLPHMAVLSGKARSLLTALSQNQRFVAGIVTGRSIQDLDGLVGIPGLVYAGNHGLEITGLGSDFVHPGVQPSPEALDEVTGLLRESLDGVPGLFVEHKGLSLTVHFRASPDSYNDQIDRVTVETAAPFVEQGLVRITRGKKVVEVRPNVDWGKGKAIAKILDAFPEVELAVFIGDDQTDEEGFETVQERGGLGVFVGPPGASTAALHRVESPDEVLQMLELILES